MNLKHFSFFFLLFCAILFFTQCKEACYESKSKARKNNKDLILTNSWRFINNNHYSGDKYLVLFSNGDICSSKDSTRCDNPGFGSYGAWYNNEKTLFCTVCSGSNTIVQSATYTLSSTKDTLTLTELSHSGGIFGRDTNILVKVF